MKTAWAVLLITALTDFVLGFSTGLTTAMAESHTVGLPSASTLLVAALGGIIIAARTVQQALKSTPETSAALKGDPVPVTTSITKTTTTPEKGVP